MSKECTLTNEQLIDKAQEWISKLAKTGGKSWSLQVPVNFNNDPDMIFSELCKRLNPAMFTKNTEVGDWHLPVNDVVHVPDPIDPLINKISMQIAFHINSGKSLTETVCKIAHSAQKFFRENPEYLILDK